MKIILSGLTFTLLSLLLASCHVGPSNNELLSESDVILTRYNESYNFSSQQFFGINEQVYTLNDKGEKDSLSTSSANELTNQVIQEMKARGYTYVYKDGSGNFGYDPGTGFVMQDPDLGLNISAVSNTTTITSYYYPGGGYYGGYWGYGYGYYYPYYPVSYSYEYKTGLVIVDMFQYNATIAPGEKRVVEWTGVVRGIDNGSKSTNLNAAKSGINQMFSQSPYITRPVN